MPWVCATHSDRRHASHCVPCVGGAWCGGQAPYQWSWKLAGSAKPIQKPTHWCSYGRREAWRCCAHNDSGRVVGSDNVRVQCEGEQLSRGGCCLRVQLLGSLGFQPAEVYQCQLG